MHALKRRSRVGVWSVAGVLGATCLLGAVSPAAAQPRDAQAAFAEGARLFNANRCAEAAVLFERVVQERSSARAQLALGRAYQCVGNHVRAVAVLEAALASPNPLPEAERAPAQAALATSRQAVVSLSVEPAEATVRVDQQPSVRSPEGYHLLTPGAHRLEVRAEGRTPFVATESYTAGAQPRVVLEALPAAPTPATPAAPAAPAGSATSLRASSLLAPTVLSPATATPAAHAEVPQSGLTPRVGEAPPRSRFPWAVVIPVGVAVVAAAVVTVVLLSDDNVPSHEGSLGPYATF